MKTYFLSLTIKKSGYILLMISAILFFVITSGLFTTFLHPDIKVEDLIAFNLALNTVASVVFLLAIIFIVFGRGKKNEAYLSNRLLLPHYFKYAGYIYLCFTVLFAITNHKYRYVKTVKSYTHAIPSYQDGLTDEQNKVFDSIKQGGTLVHSSSIIITPVVMILPVGLLFLAFAKEKSEDELISTYRTQSLQLAILLLFFIMLYQKFNVPEINTLILTSKKGVGYFDIPGAAWRADMLINVVLIFCILRMEYMLRLKPLFTKRAEL